MNSTSEEQAKGKARPLNQKGKNKSKSRIVPILEPEPEVPQTEIPTRGHKMSLPETLNIPLSMLKKSSCSLAVALTMTVF